jgi:hypothetical protein
LAPRTTDGDHINVAFTSLPRIVAFFEKHKRKAATP